MPEKNKKYWWKDKQGKWHYHRAGTPAATNYTQVKTSKPQYQNEGRPGSEIHKPQYQNEGRPLVNTGPPDRRHVNRQEEKPSLVGTGRNVGYGKEREVRESIRKPIKSMTSKSFQEKSEKATGVPAELKQRYGEDWREKAYGNIEGYKTAISQRVKDARTNVQKLSKPTVDATGMDEAKTKAQAKLDRLTGVQKQVQERRKELGVGKYKNQQTSRPAAATGAVTATPGASSTATSTSKPGNQKMYDNAKLRLTKGRRKKRGY
jgi:hypothetical protein